MIGYYASVMDGPRRGLLLGPFADLEAAAARVEQAKALARTVNDRAIWFAYGTARVEADTLPQGRLNTLAEQQCDGVRP